MLQWRTRNIFLYKYVRLRTSIRRFCSVMMDSDDEEVVAETRRYRGKNKKRYISTTKNMHLFFENNPVLANNLPHIPQKYLRHNKGAEHHYLICPTTAKDIVDKIMPFLDLSGKQLIAETNTGLGLITGELLDRGVNFVRMYENCPEFRVELKVSCFG